MKGKMRRFFVVLLLILAALSIALGVFYFTVDTNFLADDFGRHPTHGIVFTALGIIFAVGAGVAWRWRSR